MSDPKGPSAYQPYHSDDDARRDPNPATQADAMGATVIAYLITGPIVFGGLGWLLATWTDLTFFIPLGMLGGMALSLYTIWLRYGRT